MFSDFNIHRNITFRARLPSPLYTQMRYEEYKPKDSSFAAGERDSQYTEKMLKLIIQIVLEMGVDHTKHFPVINKVLMAMKEETYIDVLPKEKDMFDTIVAIIRDTVRYKDGVFIRVHPSHHGTEPSVSTEPNQIIVTSINQVLCNLPVLYTEEILLIEKKKLDDSVSLYNYENGVSDYYSDRHVIVHKREIINVPLFYLDKQFRFKVIMTMPLYLNGVGRYLSRGDMLKMRLVSKACHNNMVNYSDKLKGIYVFDVFFLWFQEYYYQKKTRKRALLSTEVYKEWKKSIRHQAKSLIVTRKYAQHEFVNTNIYHDNPVPIRCDLHAQLYCRLCEVGEDVGSLVHLFYGFCDFSPEISCLLRVLFSQLILLKEDIPFIINDTIVIYREEHLLLLIYWYICKMKRNIPNNIRRVFFRYRKRVLYWFMAYRSALSMHKSSKPPSWSDIVLRADNVYRRPQGVYTHNVSLDFRRYDCMLRYDFSRKQYFRSTISEAFFQLPMLQTGNFQLSADMLGFDESYVMSDQDLSLLGVPLDEIRTLPREIRAFKRAREEIENDNEQQNVVRRRQDNVLETQIRDLSHMGQFYGIWDRDKDEDKVGNEDDDDNKNKS